MPGVTWSQRQPTDWLASNGRWYPATSYPRGWSTSALPPAPGHGGIGSILRRYADSAAALAGVGPSAGTGPSTSAGPYDDQNSNDDWDGWSEEPNSQRESSSAIVRTGRTVADATVTAQRTHSTRVSAGAPPPPAIGSPGVTSTPPAPSRISDTAATAAPPAPIARTNTPYIPKPSPPKKTGDVIAGDLGRVLGTAKRRIEKAIDDAAQA